MTADKPQKAGIRASPLPPVCSARPPNHSHIHPHGSDGDSTLGDTTLTEGNYCARLLLDDHLAQPGLEPSIDLVTNTTKLRKLELW